MGLRLKTSEDNHGIGERQTQYRLNNTKFVMLNIIEKAYYTFQEAFDACPSDGTETTVEVLRNCTTDMANIIEENKNV